MDRLGVSMSMLSLPGKKKKMDKENMCSNNLLETLKPTQYGEKLRAAEELYRSGKKLTSVSPAGAKRQRAPEVLETKYNSALEQINELETNNVELRGEIAKLKLSLALKESECVNLKEPLGESPTDQARMQALLQRKASMSQGAVVATASSGSRLARRRTEEQKQQLRQQRRIEKEMRATLKTIDWTEMFEDLVESESFRLVGSGGSVLDNLSAPCKRDLIIRYCDILDTITQFQGDP